MGTGKLHNFLVLSGREYASGCAEWNEECVMVGNHVHIAGKEFEDARDDLSKHLDGSPVAVQVNLDAFLADAREVNTPEELLSTLSVKSGLAHNNIATVLIDKGTGKPIKPGESHHNGIAVGFSKLDMARHLADIASLGIPDPIVSIRILDAIGALRASMRKGATESPVLCASIMANKTHLFLVTPNEIADIGEADYGFSNVLVQIMVQLSLKFEGSAARLFFGNVFDFDPMGEGLAAPLAEKILCQLATHSGPRPTGLMISGLPPSRTRMFARHISKALELAQVCLPINVKAMEGTGLTSLPPEGAPSLVHMLTCAAGIAEDPDFFVDLSRQSTNVEDYIREGENAVPVRMYRGIAFGPDGTPIDKPNHHEDTRAHEQKHEGHKHIRYYRGTPIEEDAETPETQATTASAAAETPGPALEKAPAKGFHGKPVRYYRGTPIVEDTPEDSPAKSNTGDPVTATAGASPTPVVKQRKIIRYYRGTPIYADD